tara:strand:+ start:4841 stop:5941 length:1101 start_codon:yes stop_codon:yes gene_type:complete
MTKDYYKILGVSKDSTREQIKKAYKKLAKKYHPDVNKEPNASEKFKEINEAAAVLGDDKKRKQYDQYGTADFNGRGFDFSGFHSGGANFDFGDLFESMFSGGMFGGGRRQGKRVIRGADLQYGLEISLEEAATGTKKTIAITKMDTCTKCDGTGAKSKSGIKTCPDCHGSGMVRQIQKTFFGVFQTTTSCRKCYGEGNVIKDMCNVCDGTGRIRKTKKIPIKIPAGVDNGTRLRVAGEGEAGVKGGPSGDLYVLLRIKKHKIFERHGDDIFLEMPIHFATAALGGTIDVPTLEGKATLKIPSGTQSNTVFRMKNKGIPNLRGYGTGSQNIKVIIDVPKKLTKKQKDVLKQFKKLGKKKSLIEKVLG